MGPVVKETTNAPSSYLTYQLPQFEVNLVGRAVDRSLV
jgi:hypothetical protein